MLTRPARPTPFAFPLLVEMFRESLSTEALEARVARMVAELEAAAKAGSESRVRVDFRQGVDLVRASRSRLDSEVESDPAFRL